MTEQWTTRSVSSGIGKEALAEPHIDEHLLGEKVVVLVQGTNLFGDKIFSYVQMTLASMRDFAGKMRAGEKFKPSDFGTVLAAGQGEPTDDLRQEMAVTYSMVDVPQSKTVVPTASSKSATNFKAPKFFDDDN